MSTFNEIAQHAITGNPYLKREGCAEHSKESKVYNVLEGATSPDIIQKVRQYVNGMSSIEEVGEQINAENSYQFLAASKVVSLDTPVSEMKNTTFKIRELCVLKSENEENGRDAINMLNAFSNPPLDMEDVDILLLNELDNNHPVVKKAAFGQERGQYLKRIYTYCQEQAQILPEIAKIAEAVIRERFETMVSIAGHLPEKTMVVFKGCSGAGKSYALMDFTEKHVQHITAFQAVQSTDNVKNDILVRTGKVFSDNQVHLFGFSAFRMLSKVMKDEYPVISSLQEGWFNSESAVEGLFKDLKALDLKLDMRDFDGDCEAIFLRVLSRHNDPNSPKPPIEAVIRGFKTSRESRSLLLESLRGEDQYRFHYVDSQGIISDEMDPKMVISDPALIDSEIEKTKCVVINEEHVRLFGKSLEIFIGMNISEAFSKLKKMNL